MGIIHELQEICDESQKTMFWDVSLGQFGNDDRRSFFRQVLMYAEGDTRTDVIKAYQDRGLDVKRCIPVTGTVLLNCLELLEYCDFVGSKK